MLLRVVAGAVGDVCKLLMTSCGAAIADSAMAVSLRLRRASTHYLSLSSIASVNNAYNVLSAGGCVRRRQDTHV